MPPGWLSRILQYLRCERCERRLSVVDIDFVGCERRGRGVPEDPLAVVILSCRQCGRTARIEIRVPVDDLIEGLKWLAAGGTSGPPRKPTGVDVTAHLHPEMPRSPRFTNIFGKHHGPVMPISKQEQKQFLSLLNRTSFRIGTRSLQQFLKRLAPPKDPPDGPPPAGDLVPDVPPF